MIEDCYEKFLKELVRAYQEEKNLEASFQTFLGNGSKFVQIKTHALIEKKVKIHSKLFLS